MEYPSWRAAVSHIELLTGGARADWGETGELLAAREEVTRHADRINRYLQELEAVGCVFKGFDAGQESVPEASLGEEPYKEFLGDDKSDEHNYLPGRVLFMATNGLTVSPDLPDHGAFAKVVLDEDADNVYVVLSARILAKSLPILARASDEKSMLKLKKAGADRWLEVMEVAHTLGLRTSVTMVYGLGESNADRLEHLFRVREVQRKTRGFTAFICWPLQPENSELAHLPKTDAVTYLKTQAIARIVLPDVPNIQASWVTMGMKVGQVALRFGANDFGSLMMEENVVSAANTTYRTTLSEMQRLIADAGYTPKKRKQDYTILEDAA